MLTYLFPGQGSQSRGMGAELLKEFPEICKEASEILGYCIKTLCIHDPHNQLDQTQYTQPAMFVINALAFYKKKQNNPQIDFLAGHSLGEYNALLAANVFNFSTGLQLVKKRGELMQQARDGSMAAVIGITSTQVNDILTSNHLNSVSIANYNSYKQHIISGPKDEISRSSSAFLQFKNCQFIPLKASGAFHSRFMIHAEKSFSSFLENFQLSIPSLPVLANYDANYYHPSITKTNLAKHISHPVQWITTIERLLFKDAAMEFEEVGPGNVLTGLISRIKQQQ